MLCNLVIRIRKRERERKKMAFGRDRCTGSRLAPISPKERMMEKLFLTWNMWLAVIVIIFSVPVCLTFVEEEMTAMSLENTVLGRHFTFFPSDDFLFNLEVIIYNRKHSVLVHHNYTAKTKRFVLFREIVAVCCQNHIQHRNALCGKKSRES